MLLGNRVKMILLIIAALVLFDFPDVSSAEMIQNIQKCGKRVNSPVDGIDVDPCGTPQQQDSNCALKKGSKVRFQGTFKPPFKSKGHLEIYSTIRFQGTEYLLPESGNHACEYIYPNCNLKKKELYQFLFTLNINYPVGETYFFFLIKDRNSNKIAVCFEMKFEVVE